MNKNDIDFSKMQKVEIPCPRCGNKDEMYQVITKRDWTFKCKNCNLDGHWADDVFKHPIMELEVAQKLKEIWPHLLFI